jgi:hypothetical protein
MSDDTETAKGKREISSIGFPYLDIDDAIAVARVMLDRGAVPMDRDQLAAALGQMPTSGAFAIKLSTARMFGLIDNSKGKNELTPLGFEILDEERQAAAKSQAFLNVPLFRKVYEEFRGRQLPPRPTGLEQALVGFGVSSKQKDRARQVLDRSARSAGYFTTPAEDRLVQPVLALPSGAVSTVLASTQSTPQARAEPESQSIRHPAPTVPAFLAWLLEELPPPKSEWDLAEQADWLRAVAQGFRIVFKSDPARTISVDVRDLPDRSGA